MVYVLEAVGANRTKIGITRSTETFNRRFQNIKTGCPFPIKVVMLLPNQGRAMESAVLEHFKGRRNPGTEWVIANTDEVLEAVIKYMRQKYD